MKTLFGIFILTAICANAQVAELSGVVRDEAGAPVANVQVLAIKPVAPAATSTSLLAFGAITAADGSFRIANMDPGPYNLCANADSRRGYVNVCDWGRYSGQVTLAAGTRATGTQITMERGVRVELRLEDASALVRVPEKQAEKNPLLLGLFGAEGMFHGFVLEDRDANGHNYAIVVPEKVKMKMHISGQNLAFADERGNQVARNGADVGFEEQKGNAARKLKFSVGPGR